MDCTLPVTGSHLSLLPAALVTIALGSVLWFVARRWGPRGGLAAVLVLAVGLIGMGTRDAEAQTTCPPASEAPTTPPATVPPTTTIAPESTSTTSSTSTSSTSSTTSSTTSTTVSTGVVVTPGGGTTSTPDLTIDLTGPASLTLDETGSVTMTITNVGSGATAGAMTFTLSDLPAGLAAYPTGMTSTDWTAVQSPTGWTFTSVSGLVIAPGATSTITFDVAVAAPGANTSLTFTGTLPPGIGGETNSSNNQDATTVALSQAAPV